MVGLLAALASACGPADGKAAEARNAPPPVIGITTAAVVKQPISRYLHVTGSLMADEQAEVSAETAGRIVRTPVERGTHVAQGAVLASISPEETRAQVAEAEANAAQIEARLALDGNGAFDVERVPDVANARAALSLAESEFGRIQTLLGEKVVSQSEFDQRRTQVEAARQQYESARNAARQQFQSLQAARARVALARKSLADTTVKAPFTGLVAERRVSVGDYVTRGALVATVVRIHPLRVELTVPEQAVSQLHVGAPVTLSVDAYPGRTFEGRIRFVSPTLKADQRALTVEAIVPNQEGTLKPGLFATAEIQGPKSEPVLLVPAAAVQTASGTSRVYVVTGDKVEERIVRTGQTVNPLVEIISGITAADTVAASNVTRLSDGAHIRVEAASAAASPGSR